MSYEQNGLSPEQKSDIVERASAEGNLEEVIATGNTLVEEAFIKNRQAADQVHAEKLSAELKQETAQEQVLRQEYQPSDDEVAYARQAIGNFHKIQEKYNLDDSTVITKVGSMMDYNQYHYSDESAMRPGGWFKPNKKGPALQWIADIAEVMGYDLSEGKTAKEIIELMENRIGSN